MSHFACREYYDCNRGDEYRMPQRMINEGMVCAAIFPEDNNWHRVVIIGIYDENYVEVQ